MYHCFKIENIQNALILLYNPLKNSKYFYFGFDQAERNRKEELSLIVLKFVSITSRLFKSFALILW